jgi:hypothetical protein
MTTNYVGQTSVNLGLPTVYLTQNPCAGGTRYSVDVHVGTHVIPVGSVDAGERRRFDLYGHGIVLDVSINKDD